MGGPRTLELPIPYSRPDPITQRTYIHAYKNYIRFATRSSCAEMRAFVDSCDNRT